MKPSSYFRSVTACLVAAALGITTGCSSGPDAKATADSMGTFGVETSKGKDSIDDTLKALDALVGTKGNDIQTPLDAFKKSLTALDEQAKVVRGLADEMKAKGDAFFKAWEEESAATVSADRRAELSASYGKIKEDMIAAGESFAPFLKSLKDIKDYLALDPSWKGIESMAGSVKQAKDDGVRAKSLIDAVLVQVNAVRGMLVTKPGE